MTYDDIEVLAANKARLDFIDQIVNKSLSLDLAYIRRQYTQLMERKSFCTSCESWKHLGEFYKKTDTTIQPWCKKCSYEYHSVRRTLHGKNIAGDIANAC